MKTMVNVKHVGSVKSIRHVMTKANGGSVNLPYLNLYVHQMNKYKLEKEKQALTNRLREIEKQIDDIDQKTRSLRPGIMSALDEKPGKSKRRGRSNEDGRKRVMKKVRLDY
ncbi:MAG: hypothetical protein ABIE74_01100 [Pseudomonadota bacterium]